MSNHELLGVLPGTVKQQLAVAFRREMLLWHPDVNRSKAPYEQVYALVRSQAITRAFRELKSTF
jgi:curved DNA-binding protein CbpA